MQNDGGDSQRENETVSMRKTARGDTEQNRAAEHRYRILEKDHGLQNGNKISQARQNIMAQEITF